MLLELLTRCSQNWLENHLSESAIQIAEAYLGRALKKIELSRAVANKYSISFITNKNLRNELITKLKIDEIKEIYPEVENLSLDEKYMWKFLEEIFSADDRSLLLIADYLGIKDEYLSSLDYFSQTKDIILSSPSYRLYPYQRKICRIVEDAIDQRKTDRLIIHLPTGAGKTRTAMNLACSHLRSQEDGLVVWLADTEELCSQAALEFNKAWSSIGNRDVSIYSYYSDSVKTLNGIKEGFIVAGLQRLNSRKNIKEGNEFRKILKHASLIIFDEAHKIIATTYKGIVDSFMNESDRAFLIGLSATPGRTFGDDEEDQRLSEFFNQQKVTMEVDGYRSPTQYLIDEKYLAEPEYLPIDYAGSKELEFTEKEIKEELNRLLRNLSMHESRNAAIIKQAILEYENGSSIIIFACNVEHAVALAETLQCLGYPAASLTSSNDSKESRRYKIQSFKSRKIKIMINFGILTTGFDAPCTNVAIIARPTLSLVLYSQMAGRAMRGKQSGGNEKCKIYTVLDNIPEFTSLGKAFGYWNSNWNELGH